MTTTTTTTKLTLDDILDLREYERSRDDFRKQVIELKRARRVEIGPFVTLVFENRETIRFQIQEMARIEKLFTDDAIEAELAAYNSLIPDPGHLSATLFIELTSKDELMDWLPRLVGIERAVQVRLGEGDAVELVPSIPEEAHDAQLTREETTASVHYIRFALSADQVEAFVGGPAALAVDHPAYQHETELSDATRRALADDLQG